MQKTAAGAPGSGASSGTWLRRHKWKLIGSVMVGAAFIWLLRAGALPLLPGKEALSRVKWWTIPAYVVLWTAVHFIRAARWKFLLLPIQDIPLRRLITVAFIGFAAIVLLPLRMGEAARPVLIRRKGLSGWAATGTVGAERILDGLVLSVMLLIALQVAEPLSPLPDRIGNLPVSASVIPGAAYAALALFAGAFITMGAFYWRRAWARKMTDRIVGLLSLRLAGWMAERVEHVADGLRFLREPRFTLPFIAATIAYWLLNSASTWFLAWGCGLDGYSFVMGCVTTGVLALGILVPNAPGFFGAYQVSVYASLVMYYSTDVVVREGAAYVFLAYLCQLFITIGAGVLAMLVEHVRPSEALDSEAVP